MNESIPNGAPAKISPNLANQIPNNGQIIKNPIATTGVIKNASIETSLVPEKNPNTVGIWNVWNLLYSHDENRPIVIPPNTEV